MSTKFDLKEYRKIIWREWQPIVGRKKLSSFEYPLIEAWYRAGVQLQHVLWAIRDCLARAEQKGTTLRSLGVIAPDLQRVRRQSARMRIGEVCYSSDSWREKWSQDLSELAGEIESEDLEKAAMYRELAGRLRRLSLEETKKLFAEIAR
ncbi:MAG TPA: hypothetical protein VJX67_21420 [Blastocatellia bacterium]|nr:hypothetical protein [Blastocatellia bacterium]